MSNQEILDELRNLKEEIKKLSSKIENLDRSCSRMDDHINFVENTYDILRTPLNVVSNLVTNTFSSKKIENKLPSLKNNN
jgi:archaellum component FlaC